MDNINLEISGWNFDIFSLSLIVLSVIFALWQIIFHYKYFFKLYKFKSPELDSDFPISVSVIISARNEKINLKKNLESILTQDYPNFEVVVVDDASWDGTNEVLAFFEDKFPEKLRIVTIDEEIKKTEGKKFALTLGIKASKNEILLLTDADCIPVSNEWIKRMVLPYSNPEINLVLGYSPYKKKASLLNFIIRAETSFTAAMYFSLALAKKPYMGVGRNLSYRRELFFENKGFATHYHIPYGDDDLFVRDAADAHKTEVVIHPKSRMISTPKKKFVDWILQKRRHLFVGRFYKPEVKRVLGAFSLSHFLFWISAILLFFISPSIYIPLGIIVLRWILIAPVLFGAFNKLGHITLSFFMPLLDFFYIFYTIFSGIVFMFSKKPKW